MQRVIHQRINTGMTAVASAAHPVLAGYTRTPATARHRWEPGTHYRPVWVAALLSFLTSKILTAYAVYWLGRTWDEIKQERAWDEDMRPVWHALAFLIPIYRYILFYQHVRAIDELLERSGTSARIQPGNLTGTLVVGNGLATMLAIAVSIAQPDYRVLLLAIGIVDLTRAACLAAVIGAAQEGLNAYWRAVTTRVSRPA